MIEKTISMFYAREMLDQRTGLGGSESSIRQDQSRERHQRGTKRGLYSPFLSGHRCPRASMLLHLQDPIFDATQVHDAIIRRTHSARMLSLTLSIQYILSRGPDMTSASTARSAASGVGEDETTPMELEAGRE